MTNLLRAGVMGWPVKHSKSPRMHSHWLRKYGINGSYTHVESRPEAFLDDLHSLVRQGWRGTNVTIPHKEAALAAATDVTPRARAIGAANTLVFDADGHILADNTDGYGFMQNLIGGSGELLNLDKPALVLGAGGASRAIIHSLLEAGCPEVRLANRTRERAEVLRMAFGSRVHVIAWEKIETRMAGAGLIVNTTSLGMEGQSLLTLNLGQMDEAAVATDIVYTPLVTPFLQAASDRGLAVVDGLGMLLHQARPGFEAWFGQMPDVDDELRTLMLAP